MVTQLFVKTSKIEPLENFPLYSTASFHCTTLIIGLNEAKATINMNLLKKSNTYIWCNYVVDLHSA